MSFLFQNFRDFLTAPFPKFSRAKWTATDATVAVLGATIVLSAVIFGGYFFAVKIFGELAAATAVVEHFAVVFVGALLLQIFFEMAFLIIVMRRRGGKWGDLGFERASLFSMTLLPIALFGIGVLLQEGYFSGLKVLDISPTTDPQILHRAISEKWLPLPVIFIFAGVLAPILEEMLFRGFLLRGLLEKFSPKMALFLSAFFFAAAHLSATFFPVYLALGLLLGFVFLRTKSLFPGIFFHAINNSVALFLFLS